MTRKQKAIGIAVGVGAGVALAQFLRSRRRVPAFPGQVALITGGSRGLGLALAREFAAEGCKIAICARDEQELARARKDLEGRGAEVLTVVCDVARRDQVENMIHQVQHRYGSVDILVNNAGVIEVGPVENFTVEDFQEAMDTMFWGTVYTTLELLPSLVSRGSGRIVNISSIGGKVAVPHLLPYSSAKFAVAGFSEGLRAELLPKGVFVTTIAPGLMRTGSYVNAFFKGDQEKEGLWFSLSSALPGFTISARRAAREIVEAVKQNEPERVLSKPAQLLAKAQGLFPGQTSNLLSAVSEFFLPGSKKRKWRKVGAALSILQSPLVASLLTAGAQAGRRLNQPGLRAR